MTYNLIIHNLFVCTYHSNSIQTAAGIVFVLLMRLVLIISTYYTKLTEKVCYFRRHVGQGVFVVVVFVASVTKY